jgi:hypothetical protein
MRENRTYGSEGGGGGKSTVPSYPYHQKEQGGFRACARRSTVCLSCLGETLHAVSFLRVRDAPLFVGGGLAPALAMSRGKRPPSLPSGIGLP